MPALRPIEDSAVGVWTPSDGTSQIWQCLDDSPDAPDALYVSTGTITPDLRLVMGPTAGPMTDATLRLIGETPSGGSLNSLEIRDQLDGSQYFFATPSLVLTGGLQELPLVLYGPPHDFGNLLLVLSFTAGAGPIRVDAVELSISTGSAGSGSGPGGQLGQNAAILHAMM